MGLPALVTRCDLRSISLKADWSPYCDGVSLFGLAICMPLKRSTYPLSLELLATLRMVDRVGEDTIIVPQLQLRERRATSKQVENAAHQGALLRAQLNTRRSLNIRALNLELSDVGRRHSVLLL